MWEQNGRELCAHVTPFPKVDKKRQLALISALLYQILTSGTRQILLSGFFPPELGVIEFLDQKYLFILAELGGTPLPPFAENICATLP